MEADFPWTPAGLGEDRYEHLPVRSDESRVYGGLIAAQMLAAAADTADAPCNSMHVQFLSPGTLDSPLETTVDRLRDGRSFSARSVRAAQGTKLTASALISFSASGNGPAHQVAMPAAPEPEALEDQREIRRRNAVEAGRSPKDVLAERIIDARAVELPVLTGTGGIEAQRLLWFRSRRTLPGSMQAHQALLAFASDMGLVHVGMAAHNALCSGSRLNAASLDHAIWFHDGFRADQWLLYSQRADVAGNGRGLTRGSIFTRDGRMVASTAQEVLIRYPVDR